MRRFHFTKRAIEALLPHEMDSPSRESEYTDVEFVGLHLRVSKGVRKFFQHRYRHLGRKKCLTLGEFPHVTGPPSRSSVAFSVVLETPTPSHCVAPVRETVSGARPVRRVTKE